MKNYLIGIILLVLAFFLLWRQGTEQIELAEQEAKKEKEPPASVSTIKPLGDQNQSTFDQNTTTNPPVSLLEGNASVAVPVSKPVQSSLEQTTFALENKYSSLEFSNHTGGVREVRLKKQGRLSKDYNMTNEGEPLLSMSFEDQKGQLLPGMIPDPRAFKLIETPSKTKILYEWELPGQLRVEREYVREANSTYLIKHQTRITKLGNSPLPFDIDRIRLHLGSAFQISRLYNPFDSSETYLNVGYYNAGEKQEEGCSCAECSGRIDGEAEEFFQYNEMPEKPLQDITSPVGPWESRTLTRARWACVNNQFFVNIVRPEMDLGDVRVDWRIKDKKLPVENEETGKIEYEWLKGVEGRLSVPLGRLKPGVPEKFDFHIYAGPKDYIGLSDLQFEQKKVMQFGIFWWISEPFSWMLNKLHSLLHSYGLAIVALTILLKLCLWPLTAKATRSQKKMQALQGPIGEIKVKHQGNPQKLNQEMMKFYKENKVNPFAGCWPILIQMPIFLGMFWMLRSAAELYGQGFLWAQDLSEQDSIAILQDEFSINLLPILMVASQWYQMKLNPMQMGPEMSDAQRINAKMMRLMPFMFLVFLYFFSSALVLYWTVQNLMTILQTLITKRDPLPNEEIQNIDSSVDDDGEDEISVRSELSDEEKRCRNLLGLRAKGPIDSNLLERKYQERLQNYKESKLAQMSPTKKEQALEKKDRLEKAYQFLIEQMDKQT